MTAQRARSCGSGSPLNHSLMLGKSDLSVSSSFHLSLGQLVLRHGPHSPQIGSVPTPWPSWLIAAHPSSKRAPPAALRAFLTNLTTYVRAFDSAEKREGGANLQFIKEKFGYPEDDIKVRLFFDGFVVIGTITIINTTVVVAQDRVLPRGLLSHSTKGHHGDTKVHRASYSPQFLLFDMLSASWRKQVSLLHRMAASKSKNSLTVRL